nr:hypothetical protein B0A51_07317 [Rachicladosporium sp. CCFEE 5018]
MLTSRSLSPLLAVSIASVLAAPLEERATDQPQLATFEDLGNGNSVKVYQGLIWPSFKTIQADLTGTINGIFPASGTHAITVTAPSYRFISKTKDLDSFHVTSLFFGCLERDEGALALRVAIGCKVIIKGVKKQSTTIIQFGTFEFKPALGGLLPSNMEKADKIAGRSLLIDDLKHVKHLKGGSRRSLTSVAVEDLVSETDELSEDTAKLIDDELESLNLDPDASPLESFAAVADVSSIQVATLETVPAGTAIGTYQNLIWNLLTCQSALLGTVDGIKPVSGSHLPVSTGQKAVLRRPNGLGVGAPSQFAVTEFSFACAAKFAGKVGVGEHCELTLISSRGLKVIGVGGILGETMQKVTLPTDGTFSGLGVLAFKVTPATATLLIDDVKHS